MFRNKRKTRKQDDVKIGRMFRVVCLFGSLLLLGAGCSTTCDCTDTQKLTEYQKTRIIDLEKQNNLLKLQIAALEKTLETCRE